MLPDVFEARASCADAAVSLLGVPYEFWSAALFAAIGVADGRRPAPRLSGRVSAPAHSIGVCSATSSLIASSSANTAVSE